MLSGASGDVPGFDVQVTSAGKRLRVAVALARPARPGEAIELWTTGSAGNPLAWSIAWDGACWRPLGLRRAPRELPPVDGDASGLAMHVVRRGPDEDPRTPLTVVAVSPDGATRVATSDLDPDDSTTLGLALDVNRADPIVGQPQRE